MYWFRGVYKKTGETVTGSLLYINHQTYIYRNNGQKSCFGDLDDLDFGYSFIPVERDTIELLPQEPEINSVINIESNGNHWQYTVNWRDLPDEYEYIAISYYNGEVVIYKEEPKLSEDNLYWTSDHGFSGCRNIDTLYVNVSNWQETLQKRPQEEI